MTEIDTSSYNTQPSNSINQIVAMIQAKGGMQQNQLRNMDIQGQQGLADLYKNAPKDADGNPDTNYIIQNAGQAGVHANTAIQGALAVQDKKIAIARNLAGLNVDKLTQGKATNDAIVSGTVPMVQDLQTDIQKGSYDPDAYRKKFIDAGLNVINASMGADGMPAVTPQHILASMNSLNFDNPLELQKALINKQSQAQAWDGHIQDALALKAGSPGTAEIGGMTQPTTRSLYSNEVTPSGPVIPTGTSFQGTKADFNTNAVPPTNPFNYSNPNNPNNPNNAAANSSQPMPSGGKPAMPGVPGSAVQSAPITAPPGNVSAAHTATSQASLPVPPPGYQSNLDAGMTRVNEAIQHANDVTPLAAPLKGVLQLADSGGPNQALYAKMEGALSDGPLKGLMDPAVKDVTKFEILNKMASDVVGQNMGANASTDIGRSVQALSNPNSSQFPGALRTVAKFLLARTDSAKAYGDYLSPLVGDKDVSPSKIVSAESQWRNNYDQNLFELPYMNDDERKNLIGGMAPKERDAFMKKGQFMVQQGLLNPDDL